MTRLLWRPSCPSSPRRCIRTWCAVFSRRPMRASTTPTGPKATHCYDDKLVYQMDLARRIASLGLSARDNANLKVRQPLAKVLVHVREGSAELSAELVEIVADELNVKALEFVHGSGSQWFVTKCCPTTSYSAHSLVRISARCATYYAMAWIPPRSPPKLQPGESVTFDLNGETVSLTGEEILVSTESAEGSGRRCRQGCHRGRCTRSSALS